MDYQHVIAQVMSAMHPHLGEGAVADYLPGLAEVDRSDAAFSDLIELQLEHGIPRNLFVDAGASVVADRLLTDTGDAVNALRVPLRAETGNPAPPSRPSRPTARQAGVLPGNNRSPGER
ncbi:hypothetical protein ACIRRA_01775 [Nocardia sp. NPDC101769]|uniref:hypothetical protein n=1 Tax=Nocardia sp. NPDC101769 TaxID=3364333 RepID=UPI00381E7633